MTRTRYHPRCTPEAWMGLEVRPVGEVHCYAGRVDPGPGKNPPFRSEAYNLLVEMRVCRVVIAHRG